MRYFPISADISLGGVFVKGGEFLVDVSSRYDAAQRIDPLGALVLRAGKASLIGAPINDGFSDPVAVPLWGDFEGSENDEAAGFTRWALVIRDGDTVFDLWRHSGDNAG